MSALSKDQRSQDGIGEFVGEKYLFRMITKMMSKNSAKRMHYIGNDILNLPIRYRVNMSKLSKYCLTLGSNI